MTPAVRQDEAYLDTILMYKIWESMLFPMHVKVGVDRFHLLQTKDNLELDPRLSEVREDNFYL